jgi:hypothetical protein
MLIASATTSAAVPTTKIAATALTTKNSGRRPPSRGMTLVTPV